MALHTVYAHSMEQSFKASVLSKASVFQFISLLVTIVGPLLIAYRSQGFWLKTNQYREQPEVHFKHDFLFLLQSKQADRYWVWSSFPGLNKLEAERLRIPVIYSKELDINRNGKPDQLQLSAKFPLEVTDNVHTVQVMLLFDYKLSLQSRFQMESMVYINEQTLTAGQKIQVHGDLSLFQRIPLWYRGSDQRFNEPVINGSSISAHSYLLSNILTSYYARNVSTRLEPYLAAWTPAPFSSETFEVEFKIEYVEQDVLYYCGFWELIKWGWIQYLSIFLVFVFAVKRIRRFVFMNRLVAAVPQSIRAWG